MFKKNFFKGAIYVALCCCFLSCGGQTKVKENTLVGGAFENAEYMDKGMPIDPKPRDTSAAWNREGQKLLITGTIYQRDGRTPAKDVVLYYYQTNTAGKYHHDPKEPRSMAPNNLGQTHGYIRGWIKTGADGKYAIYTIRPGTYPTRDEPAHIHLSVREPNLQNSYYLDDLVFDDDPILNTARRRKLENRGGSGVLRVLLQNDRQVAEHNIILGLNIPNYPIEIKEEKKSGLEIGEDNPSFIPFHAYGPDKGSRACPVCKYGRYHGIVYFVSNHPDWTEIKQWLQYLETESTVRRQYLKAYFVYSNAKGYDKTLRRQALEKIGDELKLKQVALTFVPSVDDKESEMFLNKINAEVTNTFVIYKNRRIVEKFIDLKPTVANFEKVSAVLDNTRGPYFDLPAPPHN